MDAKAVAVLITLTLLTLGCGRVTVATVDEARVAIRKIVDGADPGEFKAAPDAPASVRAILADGSEVGSLERELNPGIGRDAGAGCDAASLLALLGQENDDGVSVSYSIRAKIRQQVADNRPNLNALQVSLAVDPVLNAAVGLTESTVVEVTDKACSSIQHL